jgi:site-specific recombinase XerD
VKRAEKREAGPEGAPIEVSVAEAIASYLGDCAARNLAGSTIESYTKSLEHLSTFCTSKGVRAMDGIDLGSLTDFRAGRKVKPSTSSKELETLRAFCAFSKKRGWMADNFAQELEPPREDGPPTLPFGREEVDKILEACGNLEDDNPHTVERTRARARAMCLVMLYSGMRISDTILLKRAAVDLDTGKLLLRVMKTGAPLYVRLGKPATEALAALPGDGEYFFWNGASKLYTAIGNARKTISRVLAVAKVKGHPHRFRDTFSVSLLEKGENLHTVQLLLGHTSIKTTEKHYAPFVESFQRVLDAATSKLDFGTKTGTIGKRTAKLLKIG